MKKREKTAIVLISGGLDSVVSIAKTNCKIKLGLYFDYGQKAIEQEYKAAKRIASHYNFPVKLIKLDWLKEIITNGLIDTDKIHQFENLNNISDLKKSMESVWIPNRNALFINIAASFCEALDIDKIIIGANREEAKVFKDNSKNFIKQLNKALKTSTNKNIELEAPLINYNKRNIIKEAIKLNAPIEKIYSCYLGEVKHCGKCESCLHLKKSLEDNKQYYLIKKLF